MLRASLLLPIHLEGGGVTWKDGEQLYCDVFHLGGGVLNVRGEWKEGECCIVMFAIWGGGVLNIEGEWQDRECCIVMYSIWGGGAEH